MAFLITGGTGFLGHHLLAALQKNVADAKIILLVRNRAAWEAHAAAHKQPHVTAIEGDFCAPQTWEDNPALHNLRGIFHLAAQVQHSRCNIGQLEHINVFGTGAMVRIAAKLGCRMVFVSTSGTVGCSRDAQAAPYEDAPYCEAEVGGWPYYASKIRAERQAHAQAAELGAQIVIVRPPMLLGPGDHRFRSTGQIIRFLRGKLPFLIRGGIHYVDIRDAAGALVAAMVHAAPQPIYHLRGTACSIDQFFTDVAEIAQKRPPRLHLPARLAWHLASADGWLGMRLKNHPLGVLPDPVVIEMATHHWGLGSRHAEKDLQFAPRPGKQTLVDTVTWLRAHRSDC